MGSSRPAHPRGADTEPEPPTGPPMTDAERAELDARLARMFRKPLKSELGNGRFFLLWTARDESDAPRMMGWNPENWPLRVVMLVMGPTFIPDGPMMPSNA